MRKTLYYFSIIVLPVIKISSSYAGRSNIPDWMQDPEKQSSLGVIMCNAITVISFIGFIIGVIGWFWGLLEMKEMIPGDPEKGVNRSKIGIWSMVGSFVICVVSRMLVSIP